MTESIQQQELVRIFKENGCLVVAEIGCYRGETTRILALSGLKVIAIDPFIGGYDERDKVSKWLSENDVIPKAFQKNVEGFDNIVFMKLKGIDAYNQYNELVDGFFLDSVHTFEGVKEDAIWINKVKPNGILAFHDYTLTFPGVKQWIDENMIGKFELIKQIGTLIIFRNRRIDE